MDQDLTSQFKYKYETLGGIVHLAENEDAGAGVVLRIIEDAQARQLPQAIDAARVGVSRAALAVAETGSLVEFTTNDALRLVSALPSGSVARTLPMLSC